MNLLTMKVNNSVLFSCRNQFAGKCKLVLQSTFSAHCPSDSLALHTGYNC